jgi:hypothetical protein
MENLTAAEVEGEQETIVKSIRAVEDVGRGGEPNKEILMPFAEDLKESYDKLKGQDEKTRGKVVEILGRYKGLGLLEDDQKSLFPDRSNVA